jgi:hypothetical protein
MDIARFHTMADAVAAIGEGRSLLQFLMNTKKVPHQIVGNAKVMDDAGLAMLKREVAEYRRQFPRQRTKRGRPRKRKPAASSA